MKQIETKIFKPLTKGEIRASAMEELKLKGFHCWKQNNLAVRKRKFIGEYGITDIMGFHKLTACVLACEVKANGDKLSDDQKKFLTKVKQSGGHAFLAVQERNIVVLQEWTG